MDAPRAAISYICRLKRGQGISTDSKMHRPSRDLLLQRSVGRCFYSSRAAIARERRVTQGCRRRVAVCRLSGISCGGDARELGYDYWMTCVIVGYSLRLAEQICVSPARLAPAKDRLGTHERVWVYVLVWLIHRDASWSISSATPRIHRGVLGYLGQLSSWVLRAQPSDPPASDSVEQRVSTWGSLLFFLSVGSESMWRAGNGACSGSERTSEKPRPPAQSQRPRLLRLRHGRTRGRHEAAAASAHVAIFARLRAPSRRAPTC